MTTTTNYTWNPLTDSVIEESDASGNVIVTYTNEPTPFGPGRILKSLALEGKLRCDASCLLEEFFGTSGFDPRSQANHGFCVIA